MNKAANILIIEDDDIFRKTLSLLLTKEGHTLDGVNNADEAFEAIEKNRYHLVISDIRLPGTVDGIDILQRIKQSYEFPCKMILMTGFADKEAPLRAIRLGVDDYIYKPFEIEEFLHIVNKNLKVFNLEQDITQYKELSYRDGLTNLFNHRFFYEMIDREIARALRYDQPLSLLMIDVDNFKKINDEHGHLIGDLMLKEVSSSLLYSHLRSADLVFRYGGEEFALILPATVKKNAFVCAERIRKKIEQKESYFEPSHFTHMTVSIGIAGVPEDTEDRNTLIQYADQALYRAKNSGKNKVIIYEGNDDTQQT